MSLNAYILMAIIVFTIIGLLILLFFDYMLQKNKLNKSEYSIANNKEKESQLNYYVNKYIACYKFVKDCLINSLNKYEKYEFIALCKKIEELENSYEILFEQNKNNFLNILDEYLDNEYYDSRNNLIELFKVIKEDELYDIEKIFNWLQDAKYKFNIIVTKRDCKFDFIFEIIVPKDYGLFEAENFIVYVRDKIRKKIGIDLINHDLISLQWSK